MLLFKFVKSIHHWVKVGRKISNVFNENHKKFALISYTIFPFLKQTATHTNQQESIVIARLFDELGYCVDVVHYTNGRCIDYSKYDVIFGFGEPFENSFNSPYNIQRIYYATGAHVCFQNHAEIKRVQAVSAKYGEFASPKRLVPWMWSQSTTMSDALIIIGNEWTKSTYAAFTNTPIFSVNATAFINERSITINREIEKSKKNFLWFGSGGLIHKGLDLCLEYFAKHTEYNLHICGPREDDFFRIFKDELAQPNIHFYGFVDVQSDLFVEIVSQCSFAILPTCSEGQATALLTAMGGGLIPISTIYSGIDVQKYGYVIPSLDVDGLAEKINIVVNLSEAEIREKSNIAQDIIRQDHTLDAFKARLQSVLSSGILN